MEYDTAAKHPKPREYNDFHKTEGYSAKHVPIIEFKWQKNEKF